MIDGMNYGNFENLDQIGEGGRFRAIKTFCNKKKYIFKPFLVGKTVIQKDAGAVSNEMEINFLESCHMLSNIPKIFPKYYGYAVDNVQNVTPYTFFFDYYVKNLQEQLSESGGKLEFPIFYQYFQDLLNGLCFMETMGFVHHDLKP